MLTPYSHGGDIYAAAQQLGCKPSQITDFSSNINIVSPDVKVKADARLIRNYGDPTYRELYRAVAASYGLKRKEIALYNGASSAITELLRYLKPETTYLYAPLYSEYSRSARAHSRKVVIVDRRRSLGTRPKRGSTVVFVNPSTPDGKYYDLDTLFKIWEKRKCNVIIDESFLAFSGEPSIRHRIKKNKRLYVIQSFTKFYACAGLRIGAIFSHPKNVRQLTQPMWHLSSFDAAYMTALLGDPDHAERSRTTHQQQYGKLRKLLKKSALFDKVYQSRANYILTRSERAEEIHRVLYEQRVLVRECANFDTLDHRYLRFAVKDDKSLKRLKKALHAFA